VNIKPGIGRTTTPTIYPDIVARMFEKGARVPTYLLVTGDDVTLAETPADRLCMQYGCNGLAWRGGLRVDGVWLQDQPGDGYSAGQLLLGEAAVGGALCVMTVAEVARFGLPVDRFDAIHFLASGQRASGVLAAIRPHTATLEMEGGVA
jgi:hypothetical protein